MRGRMDGAARAAPLTRLICIAMQASARISPRGLYIGADRGGDQVGLQALGRWSPKVPTGTAGRRSCSGGDIYIPRLSLAGR